jgi:hypothetical protein
MQSKGVTQLAALEKYADELARSLGKVSILKDEFRDKNLGLEIIDKARAAETALTRCRSDIARKSGRVVAKGYR